MPALQPRGRAGRSRRLVNDINVVPYIDVMLVLLVIFMVTAPLLPPGQIDLPSAGTSQQPGQRYIDAKLDKSGKITLTTMNVATSRTIEATKRDLAEKAKALGANKADVPVVISADRKATYESVVEVLDVLRNADIRAALMVKPGS